MILSIANQSMEIPSTDNTPPEQGATMPQGDGTTTNGSTRLNARARRAARRKTLRNEPPGLPDALQASADSGGEQDGARPSTGAQGAEETRSTSWADIASGRRTPSDEGRHQSHSEQARLGSSENHIACNTSCITMIHSTIIACTMYHILLTCTRVNVRSS